MNQQSHFWVSHRNFPTCASIRIFTTVGIQRQPWWSSLREWIRKNVEFPIYVIVSSVTKDSIFLFFFFFFAVVFLPNCTGQNNYLSSCCIENDSEKLILVAACFFSPFGIMQQQGLLVKVLYQVVFLSIPSFLGVFIMHRYQVFVQFT